MKNLIRMKNIYAKCSVGDPFPFVYHNDIFMIKYSQASPLIDIIHMIKWTRLPHSVFTYYK